MVGFPPKKFWSKELKHMQFLGEVILILQKSFFE